MFDFYCKICDQNCDIKNYKCCMPTFIRLDNLFIGYGQNKGVKYMSQLLYHFWSQT